MSDCILHGMLLWRSYFGLLYVCLLIGLGWAATSPAQAQADTGLAYCDITLTPWECTSTTTSSTATQTFLPASLGVPTAFGTLAGQMNLSFASPSGASLRQLLVPYLSGSSAPQLVQTTSQSTQTVEAPVGYSFGFGPVPVGPERTLFVTLEMFGSASVTNTRTDTVVEEFYQAQQTLDAAAVSFLLGDIYAAVPLTILDDDFTFLASLLGHSRSAADWPGAAGPEPPALGFAGPGFTPPAIDATVFAAMGRSGDLVAPGWTAWLDGSVGRSALHPTTDHLGLSFGTAGTAIGADYADGPWRAGGSIAFARTGFSQPATGDAGTVTSLRAGAYGGFDAGQWSILGGLSGGYHWTQTTRLSGLPAPATTSFGSASLSAALEASRRFDLLGASFEPLAGAMFSLVSTGGFTETGTSLLDLKGEPGITKTLELYVGGRASGRLVIGEDVVARPEAHVRVLYDAFADPLTVTTSFPADPSGVQTTIVGLQPGRLALQVGAGIGVEFARNWQLALAYRLQMRGGSALAHSLSGSVGGQW